MAKRVLVVVNLDALASWAAFYGVQLAARMSSSLALMAISPSSEPEGEYRPTRTSPEALDEDQRLWLNQVVEQCQREGVSVEIYVSSGPFFEEVIRFVRSQRSVQFIVMGVPRDFPPENRFAFSAALKRLHSVFNGEILLVRERGRIIQVSDIDLQNSGKET